MGPYLLLVSLNPFSALLFCNVLSCLIILINVFCNSITQGKPWLKLFTYCSALVIRYNTATVLAMASLPYSPALIPHQCRPVCLSHSSPAFPSTWTLITTHHPQLSAVVLIKPTKLSAISVSASRSWFYWLSNRNRIHPYLKLMGPTGFLSRWINHTIIFEKKDFFFLEVNVSERL